MTRFSIPGHLPSRANQRVHWSKAQKRARLQRSTACGYTLAAMGTQLQPRRPVLVRMTRVSPRLLDDDNLQGAFKSMRDGIADAFRVDDSPSGPITWEYGQRRGKVARAEIEIGEPDGLHDA